MSLKNGDKGPAVRDLQLKLLGLGYSLPKFGADGDLGDETLQAITNFRRDHGLIDPVSDFATTVPQRVRDAIAAAYEAMVSRNPPAAPQDFTTAHPGTQWRNNRQRAWRDITGITLHQTAVLFGEQPGRWFGLHAHLGVTQSGRAYLICPLDRVVFHGNRLNDADVGIEVDGYFEGIEGKRRTFWSPPSDKNRLPLRATPQQIASVRATVVWICDEVRRHGGQVRFIHAHRQASADRESDPGQQIWQEVGLWAQSALGLSDGGRDFVVGTGAKRGLRIPRAWDPSRAGVLYRPGEPGLG